MMQRVVKSVRRLNGAVMAAGLILGAMIGNVSPVAAEPIRGSGSTFAAPVINAWSQRYRTIRADGGDFATSDWLVDYELLGSLGGILRLSQREMDFGATDAPLPSEELKKFGYRQFPFVIGGVAIATNLDGIAAGQLKLNGDVLGKLYLGTINRWNDPAIVALNPGVALPDLTVTLVHRKDGSGSTQTFTEYLSLGNQDWANKYGASTLVQWPVGTSVEGSGGVIARLKETKGTVGYVEAGQLERAGLSYVLLQNRAGNFVKPDGASFAAAASTAGWEPAKGFYARLTDATGADAFPMTAATFALVPAARLSSVRLQQTLDFFRVGLEQGALDAARLGYIAIPPDVVTKITADWATYNQATN